MNVKKSNLHTAWKYCFLLPLLVFLVCLLNEPVAYAHNPVADKKNDNPAPCTMKTLIQKAYGLLPLKGGCVHPVP